MARACRGSSVLETMLVLALVTALVLVALDRLVVVRVEAERVAMERVVQALQAAALEQSLRRRTSGDRDFIAAQPDSNPMLQLERPPPNYLGELDGPDPATIPSGQWYFDTRSRWLVYRVEYEAYFDTPLPGPARVRFKAGGSDADSTRDGGLQPTKDDAYGPQIKALDQYGWRRYPIRVGALAVWGISGTTP